MMTLYIGNQPDPADRTQIVVDEDAFNAICALIASRQRPYVLDVFDHVTGKHVTLADEDCGLGCRCALRIL